MALAVALAVVAGASAATTASDVSVDSDSDAETSTLGTTNMHFAVGYYACSQTSHGGCDVVSGYGTAVAFGVAVTIAAYTGPVGWAFAAGYFA